MLGDASGILTSSSEEIESGVFRLAIFKQTNVDQRDEQVLRLRERHANNDY